MDGYYVIFSSYTRLLEGFSFRQENINFEIQQ